MIKVDILQSSSNQYIINMLTNFPQETLPKSNLVLKQRMTFLNICYSPSNSSKLSSNAIYVGYK